MGLSVVVSESGGKGGNNGDSRIAVVSLQASNVRTFHIRGAVLIPLARSQHLCARLTHSLYILPPCLRLLPAGLSPPSPQRNMHHPPTSPDPAVHSPAVLELIELQVTDNLTSPYPSQSPILGRPSSLPPRLRCRHHHQCSRHCPGLPIDSLESGHIRRQTSAFQSIRFGRHPPCLRQDARPPHHTRLHHPRKVTPPHRDGGLGLRASVSRCSHGRFKGMSPYLLSVPATVLTAFPPVHQRLHTTECPLGSRHRCLWQTRREPDRTRVPRCPRLETRPHPKGHPRPLQYHHQPLQPPKETF